MITPLQIIEAARECVGTPYAHQGRRPGLRLDCVGLLLYPARKLGIELEDFPGYGLRTDVGVVRRAVLARTQLRHGKPQPADVVWIRSEHDPTHFAIFTERSTIIHAFNRTPGSGRVVEHGYRHPFTTLTCEVFIYPGVTYPTESAA